MNQTFSTRREFNTPIPPTGAFVYYRLEVKIHAVQTIGASDLILDLFCFIVPQVPAESGFGSIGRKKNQSGEFGEAVTRVATRCTLRYAPSESDLVKVKCFCDDLSRDQLAMKSEGSTVAWLITLYGTNLNFLSLSLPLLSKC